VVEGLGSSSCCVAVAVEFPSTNYRDHPPYVPVAPANFPHIFAETSPWLPYVSLPPPYNGIPDPRSGGFSIGSCNPVEDIEIAIKKEPNFPASPTFYDGTYCHPFAYSPVYKMQRPSLSSSHGEYIVTII